MKVFFSFLLLLDYGMIEIMFTNNMASLQTKSLNMYEISMLSFRESGKQENTPSCFGNFILL